MSEWTSHGTILPFDPGSLHKSERAPVLPAICRKLCRSRTGGVPTIIRDRAERWRQRDWINCSNELFRLKLGTQGAPHYLETTHERTVSKFLSM